MKIKILPLIVLAALAATNSRGQRITEVNNLAALQGRQVLSNETVRVRGYASASDWGNPRDYYYQTNSPTITNAVMFPAVGGGRYYHPFDGDVRTFGALPYQSRYSNVPWGYKATNSTAIGTGDFSIYIRATLPAQFLQPVGLFAVGRVPSTNVVTELAALVGLRASGSTFGVLFRGDDGGSGTSAGSTNAATLDTTPAAISGYLGQTVDMVFIRQGTNAIVYFNGVNVTTNFVLTNPAGWAKSLALNEAQLIQVGNNDNIWYWPQPVFKFALWNSALNSSQAADPSNVSGKLVDYTATQTTMPTDVAPYINNAVSYLESLGGGILKYPAGIYYVSSPIKIGNNITHDLTAGSMYASSFRQGHRSSGVVLFKGFGSTNDFFYADQSMSSEVCLTERFLSSVNGYISSRWIRSKITGGVLCGDAGLAGDGIFLDRVASVTLNNISLRGIPGHGIRAVGVNSLRVFGCDEAGAGRGWDVRGVADVEVLSCFVDGAKAPNLRWYGNLCRVANSVFEYGANPRSFVIPYEMVSSVDTSTDVITLISAYGHRLRSGHVVRFSGDALPSPLTSTNDYYAIVTGTNTLKVSTTYADEVSKFGALYSNNVVDITTTVTNTWYSGGGPAVGFLITGDKNSFTANQSQNNYGGAVIIEGGLGNNMFVGNQFVMNGLGNTDTNIAAVRIIHSSPYNSFIGNGIDDRDLVGYSQKGFVLSADADYNTFIGNTWNIDQPYIFGDPAKQLVIDAKQGVFQWNGTYGNLYIPASTGFTEWTPSTWADAAAIQFDKSAGRILIWDGDSWMHAVTAPYGSNVYWGASSGTLSAVNNGPGQTLTSLNGTYSTQLGYFQVNDSTSAGNGVDFKFLRNYSTNSSTYGALPAYTKLGVFNWGGWFSTGPNDSANSASISAWSDATAWNSTNRASQINIAITPNGSTVQTVALTFQAQAAPSAGDTMLLMTYFNGTNWVASSKRVSFGTNDSAGSGFKVLKVAN